MTHNHMQRDEKYVNRLKNEILRQYGIRPMNITPAKRGYYGETWKIQAGDRAYFLKIDFLPQHQKKFQNSLSAIGYLCDHGIDFVGKIIKSRENQLFASFDTGIMGLFEWVEGENVETDETKAAEYELLCKVYALKKPDLPIPAATFSNDAAIRFYQQWERLQTAPKTKADLNVLSIFKQFQADIEHCAARLSQLALSCREEPCTFYLTHGDAGGNFFVSGGKNYIFDWDEVMFAPLERDAWVMGCYDWARKLFSDTLKAHHIEYALQLNRIAFYCYHMFFFYLKEFLMVHPLCDQSDCIRDYLENGWIKSRIAFADTLKD